LVVHSRLAHLGVRDGTSKTQEAVAREYEAVGVLGTGVHHGNEHPGRILDAEVDNIAPKAAWTDLGGVNFNSGNVLCVLVGAGAEDDGGRR